MFSHYNITSWQNCCDARDCSWFYAHFLVGFGPVASQVISLQSPSAGWVPDAVMPRGFVLILLVPQPDLSWPCPNICALFHSQSQSLITIVCNEYNSSNLAEPTGKCWGVWLCCAKAWETSLPWLWKVKISHRTDGAPCLATEGSGRHGAHVIQH